MDMGSAKKFRVVQPDSEGMNDISLIGIIEPYKLYFAIINRINFEILALIEENHDTLFGIPISPRDRVIYFDTLSGISSSEVGHKFGLSRERTRQIYNKIKERRERFVGERIKDYVELMYLKDSEQII